MYISKVSGHRQSAVAISKSLKSLNPDCEIMSINGFGYTYPVMEKIVNTAYMGVIKSAPQIWEYLYDNPKVIKASAKLKEQIFKSSHKKLHTLIENFKPDVVICTQAFPCGMVADYKVTHKKSFKVVGVLTDFAPHLYWLHAGVDYYIVPSKEAKDRYLKEGIKDDHIQVFGIPIRDKFTEEIDRAHVAKKLGLSLEVPTVLVMGGGQGLGPIKDSVKSMMRMKMTLQLIVIAGTNANLMKWLKKIKHKVDKKIITYDYVTNVDELMAIASFIVSKPGGMTTSECLTKGLPMLIIDPIPGQEERNARFLVKSGIAVRVDDKKEIGPAIEALLNDPAKLKRMSASAAAHGMPKAAENIAKFVLSH